MKYILTTFAILTGTVIIVLDQLTKFIIKQKVPGQGIFVVNGTFLQIKLEQLENKFIAFGLAIPETLIYLFLTIIVLALLYLLYKSIHEKHLSWTIVLSIILGGAVSNIIDRIWHGAVLDFFSISFYNFTWPSFNLADVAIVVAVIILIIKELKKS
ncbi:signal peptidase II [Candidatus Kuenenbacteria bacterium]|nr:signal peptidase II [Candidatus Kuenenbacteria bacterium]